MAENRLITGATRPDLYERLRTSQQAANDDEQLRAFQRQWRRSHPVLTFLAWCGESNWRIAALILAALIIGGVLDKVLP